PPPASPPFPYTTLFRSEVSSTIENRRQQRCGSEHDGVEGNKRNEKEDRAPPVVGREFQGKREKGKGKSSFICSPARPGWSPARQLDAPLEPRLRYSGRKSSSLPSSGARWSRRRRYCG